MSKAAKTFTSFIVVVAVFLVTTGGGAAEPSSPPILNVPNTSTAPPAGSPIQVEDCKLRTNGGLLLAKTGRLIIEFTNESALTADLVRFRITWGSNDAAFIRDQGSFGPGITVKHEFKQSAGALISPLFTHPNITCSVESVHFKDGSQWTRPAPAVAASSIPESSSTATVQRILGSGFIGVVLEQTSANQVRIRLVLPGGPADNGGLKQADIIESINGENLPSFQDAVDLITATPPHTVLEFIVHRDGAPVRLRVTTASRAHGAPIDGPV